MSNTQGESVDPAHWVGLLGGFLMFVVVLLVSAGFMFPWWTDLVESPGKKEYTEISLWVLYTKYELAADTKTMNCDRQCDFTKVGSPKIRETRIGWSDICGPTKNFGSSDLAEPAPEHQAVCAKIWPVRAGTMLCWFFALLYSLLSTFNFCGAGLPASVRCAPAAKLGLGVCCFFFLIMALSSAAAMQIRLEPIPPGTKPVERPEPEPVGLNGPGFLCALVACILSALGSGVAFLAVRVSKHLAELADPEGGRPLADVQRDTAPNLDHQVMKEIYEPKDMSRNSSKDVPSPVRIGGWTNDGPGTPNLGSRPNSS